MKKAIKQAAAALLGAALLIMSGCMAAREQEGVQPAYQLVDVKKTDSGIAVEIAGKNLMLEKGVRITADSQEGKEFATAYLADGITDDNTQRWSSVNDWEDNEHWVMVRFPESVQVGSVKIFWERQNAAQYALEYSQDGKNWTTAAVFEEPSAQKEQYISLEEPVGAKYLRLHVTAVTKEEADLSLYYQNISILEIEAYGPITDRFTVEAPTVSGDLEGDGRHLVLPPVPEGYTVSLAGADYDNLISKEGLVGDTLSDVTVEVGLLLQKEEYSWELPGMEVVLEKEAALEKEVVLEKEAVLEKKPVDAAESASILPISVSEWLPAEEGTARIDNTLIVLHPREESLAQTARLLRKELDRYYSRAISQKAADGAQNAVQETTYNTVQNAGRETVHNTGQNAVNDWVTPVVLQLASDPENTLGKEGFELTVSQEQISITGNTQQGIRWGCVTLLDLLEASKGALLQGTIRDYPRYEVRGFGIDVGRRPISLKLLYAIAESMSKQKMNTLTVHLNDNQIIAQSEYDGTVEGARALYAGFRLESDLKNEDGAGITSADLYYTKEEFRQFIEDAKVMGVEVVPEIDLPAHSLAFTRVFPETGFLKDPESIDQLDLSKEKARQLGKLLWEEYLTGTDSGSSDIAGSVFENCTALHLGMDEYYGKAEAYVSYLQELSAHVARLAPDKKLRIWGSLSKMDADLDGISRELQMHIWETAWADPQDMYELGFPIINSLNSSLYIIPGGGYDELDLDFLQEEWQPNLFITQDRIWELPVWSEQMLGACYMMWNDWYWKHGDTITEEDLYRRFAEPLPVLAQKLWGSDK